MTSVGIPVVILVIVGIAALLAIIVAAVGQSALRRRNNELVAENEGLKRDLLIAENADTVALAAGLDKAVRAARSYRDAMRLASEDTANVNVWVNEAEDALTNYRYPAAGEVTTTPAQGA